MPLFAVLPVVQQTHSPQSSVPHAYYPVQHARDTFAPIPTTMSGKSSHSRTANTTPPPSHAALSAAALSGTPHSHGSGSRTLREDPDSVAKNLLCEHYDAYLGEDLANNRVYISFDSVLQNILHVPSDWKDKTHDYQRIIKGVSEDLKFKEKRETYLDQCNKKGSIEPKLYIPQASLYNVAIELINKFSDAPYHKADAALLHIQVTQPQRIAKGIFTGSNGLSPDLTGIWKPLEGEKSFVWPMIVHVEEMKGTDATLDTGENAPRVKDKSGEDPLSKRYYPARARKNAPKEPEVEAGPANKERQVSSTKATPSQATRTSQRAPKNSEDKAGSASNKRKMSSTKPGPSKAARTSQRSSPSTRPSEAYVKSTPDNKTSGQTHLQCARYLMEMLEFSILRSHAFVTLVDRDQLQLVYADRSAIVTSSIVDLRTDDGLKMFLAMLIAFHRLTPKQWGFLSLVENSPPTKLPGSAAVEKSSWLKDFTMRLQRGEDKQDACLTLGEIVYHQPGIIGRGTCVVDAKCTSPQIWQNQELVVKVSWPSKSRQSELSLLTLAREKGEELFKKRIRQRAQLEKKVEKLREAGNRDEANKLSAIAAALVEKHKNHWALRHLPNILHSQDLNMESDDEPMPQIKLALFFKNAEFINGHFEYEERTVRTTVQEKLQKLANLTPPESAQAFYDVLQCHRWLHEQPRILHRDISATNIMYRSIDGKVHGVLNDLDLSSLREDVEKGHATSFQRTGTPPYMAIELLQDPRTATPPTLHLYRHDLESLTYVILMLSSRYKFNTDTHSVERLDKPRFDDWFDPKVSWEDLSNKKSSFLSKPLNIANGVHPTFEGFVPWLQGLLFSFKRGFGAKQSWQISMDEFNAGPGKELSSEDTEVDILLRQVLGENKPIARDAQKPPPFDEETLDGHVNYTTVLGLLSKFAGIPLQYRNKDSAISEDTVDDNSVDN